jgi:hypothetical protein
MAQPTWSFWPYHWSWCVLPCRALLQGGLDTCWALMTSLLFSQADLIRHLILDAGYWPGGRMFKSNCNSDGWGCLTTMGIMFTIVFTYVGKWKERLKLLVSIVPRCRNAQCMGSSASRVGAVGGWMYGGITNCCLVMYCRFCTGYALMISGVVWAANLPATICMAWQRSINRVRNERWQARAPQPMVEPTQPSSVSNSNRQIAGRLVQRRTPTPITAGGSSV